MQNDVKSGVINSQTPRFVEPRSSSYLALATEGPKRTTGKTRPRPEETNNFVGLDDEPQAGPSRPRESRVEQTALPCSTQNPRFIGPKFSSKSAPAAEAPKRPITGKIRPRPEEKKNSIESDDEPQANSIRPRETTVPCSNNSQNPRFAGPKSSSKLAPASEAPKRSITGKTRVRREATNNFVEQEDEPQPGPSKPRESRVEQTSPPFGTAIDFEETSGESDIENDLYGCNDDDDDELEETMNGLTPDQQMKINSGK